MVREKVRGEYHVVREKVCGEYHVVREKVRGEYHVVREKVCGECHVVSEKVISSLRSKRIYLGVFFVYKNAYKVHFFARKKYL